MLELGVKNLITNPSIMSNSKDVLRILDSRTKKTKAFIIPANFSSEVEELIKELEYKKWAKDKKKALDKSKKSNDDLKEFSKIGAKNIESYLND